MHVLCRPPQADGPLLRRPFSIHDADPAGEQIALLYEIRGRGTAALANRRPGEELDLLGPLGKGFAIPDSPDMSLLLVGGGIAVAPLYFLARFLAGRRSLERATVLIGARTSEMLLCKAGFGAIGADVKVATDDGTAGYHGFVTGLMHEYVESINQAHPPMVYACGPMLMLAAAADIARVHNLACQVSAEAKMACGIGACMSCVIKVRPDAQASGGSFKYARVCKEGPVFDAHEVIWE